MADIAKLAQTAGTLSGRGAWPGPNRANADGSLQYQYFQSETQAYTQEVGQYATNVFAAECQGLNPDDFYEWRKIQIRSIRAAQAQTGSTMPGDWQRIYIINPANCTYLPQGAMLKYSDNTWIVFKDKNIAAVHGSAIVRRCNAVMNILDWYGNIVPIPLSYAKMETLGNAPHQTENTIVSKNYIAVICQLNEYTKEFDENTRLILGKTAYAMRGLDDFTREFTDDPNSVHLLTFTIERTEVQPYDSIEYGVADYGGFSWDIDVNWNNSMTVGTTQTLNIVSRRNGATVESTEEHPISYLYESSDETVATVDENGVVTGIAEGEVSIRVYLEQNPDKWTSIDISVPSPLPQNVAFTTTLPTVLHEFDSITVSAAWFEDGVVTDEPVEITFSGSENSAYGVTADELNTFRLTCYHASPKPLIVTARHGDRQETAEIRLTT